MDASVDASGMTGGMTHGKTVKAPGKTGVKKSKWKPVAMSVMSAMREESEGGGGGGGGEKAKEGAAGGRGERKGGAERWLREVVDLTPGGTYRFRAAACNAVGRGPWSAIARYITKPSVPSAVVATKCEAVSPTVRVSINRLFRGVNRLLSGTKCAEPPVSPTVRFMYNIQ
jgi:hypothetical protein